MVMMPGRFVNRHGLMLVALLCFAPFGSLSDYSNKWLSAMVAGRKSLTKHVEALLKQSNRSRRPRLGSRCRGEGINKKLCAEKDDLETRKLLTSYMNQKLSEYYQENKPNILVPSLQIPRNESSYFTVPGLIDPNQKMVLNQQVIPTKQLVIPSQHGAAQQQILPKQQVIPEQMVIPKQIEVPKELAIPQEKVILKHNATSAMDHVTKELDRLSPRQAMQIPYGSDDKKGLVATSKKIPQLMTSKKGTVVKAPMKKDKGKDLHMKKKKSVKKTKTKA